MAFIWKYDDFHGFTAVKSADFQKFDLDFYAVL